jgi:phage-related protein
MTQTLPLTTKISQTSTSQTEFRVLKIRFGNGYEQRTPDGINSSEQTRSITYSNLTSAERTTLWQFINGVGGVKWFTYTPPGLSQMKFVIEGSVSEQPLSGDLYNISFTIRQVYDLV